MVERKMKEGQAGKRKTVRGREENDQKQYYKGQCGMQPHASLDPDSEREVFIPGSSNWKLVNLGFDTGPVISKSCLFSVATQHCWDKWAYFQRRISLVRTWFPLILVSSSRFVYK